MKVKVTYIDTNSLIREEVTQNLKSKYGLNCEIEVLPASDTPKSYIEFAIRELITEEQMEYYFDLNDRGYNVKMAELKEKIIQDIAEIFDEVQKQNEKGLE